MSLKHLALGALAVLCLCQPASAQSFPGLGVGHLWAAELDYSRRFDAWSWRRSVEVARALRPGERLPFNAMTISRSTRQGHRAFEGYLDSLRRGSTRTSAALGRYSRDAIRGSAIYRTSPLGPGYVLPYRHSNYTITPGGYAIPGSHPRLGRVVSPYSR